MTQNYLMRGNRVNSMSETEIARMAAGFCHVFKLKRHIRSRSRYDKVLEGLVEYGITLDPIQDREWERLTYGFTIGHYDPATMTISVPNRVYVDACEGERDALFIIFHELGHLVLAHKALLHSSKKPPVQSEDAEWQADTFAEMVLNNIGYETKQLSFDFYL
ncbi:ImmA/IrrE family metallo-endopeptidase [Pantoea agglomerans]|uniref:ImmA/IrrE family metallo-endopeptidase n=1 Tax=Enterobacter agglomerans TaxID=549 RepID=UPI00223C03E4|nr:ImmA/IrrE family metallo-endopeptidase [Pantoea agglomerans]